MKYRTAEIILSGDDTRSTLFYMKVIFFVEEKMQATVHKNSADVGSI